MDLQSINSSKRTGSLNKAGGRLGIGLLIAWFGLVTIANASSGTVTFTWVGTGTDNDFYTVENWLNDEAPPDDSVDEDTDIVGVRLLFGNSRRTYIEYSELYTNQIEISGNTQPYYFSGSYDTTHIGSGGIIYNPNQDSRSTIDDNIQLHASQIWDIQNGTLAIKGQITDAIGYDDGENQLYGDYQIEKTGAGNLVLEGGYDDDARAGGLKLSAGTVTAQAYYGDLSNSLGFGTLIFNGGTLATRQGEGGEYSTDGEIELYNNIISNGLISIKTDSDLYIGHNENTESDFFELAADTTLQTSGNAIFIEKDITESGGSRKLTVNAGGAVVLYGSSDWHGGTQIDKGVLIFAGEDNTPGDASSIVIGSLGYAGIGSDNNVGTFLNEIDLANSTGTIGFDSDPDSESGLDTFTANVVLTGANSLLRIGSATESILGDYDTFTGGVITPQGTDYRFGGGGGTLYVASLLSDLSGSRNVVADSPAEAPLTVWLLNPNNSFTGTVSANNSAVIFGNGVPMPAGTGNFTVNASSYIGSSDASVTPASFFQHFTTNTTGIIGFDIFPTATETREIADLSMSGFNSAYVGTSSFLRDESGDVAGPGINLSGTISPNSDGVHRFAAFKGGALEVSGTLTGSSLIIGTPDNIATFGDPYREIHSTVYIGGDNSGTLANGTTFYSGQLMLGQGSGDPGSDPSTALGTGTLTVSPVNYTWDGDSRPRPMLSTAEADDIIIGNNIVLNSDLDAGGRRDFTLSGNISGTGQLSVGDESDGEFTLTLSGANSFSGGVYLSQNSSLIVNSNTGTGTGTLGFGNSGGSIYFNSQNPVIGGFTFSDGSYNYINLDYEGNQTLTINQQDAGSFHGSIYANDTTIIKSGSGTLRLEGGNIFTDGIADGQGHQVGIEITQGTLIFSNGASLYDNNEYRTPAVKVSGGSMAVAGGTTFSNPVIVGSGGKLAGFGTYTQNVSIGNGAILSPGLANNGATGSMQFYHLELDGGGIYEYNLQSPDFSDITGHDVITVNNPNSNAQTLVINADSEHPFIIKVISLDASGDAGTLTGIDSEHGLYSWTLINYDVLSVTGNGGVFDPAMFSLDVSAFSSDALNGGNFSLFQQGNQIMLGFTPVPEPSTYAMLALGLGIVAWTLRRRRIQK